MDAAETILANTSSFEEAWELVEDQAVEARLNWEEGSLFTFSDGSALLALGEKFTKATRL